jgi:glycosyltransferase involved in cell wall biosynthesis
MKRELVDDFDVQRDKITVIPFGINNAVPHTSLNRRDARLRLGIGQDEKVVLFFGNITPYKGLEYLVEAVRELRSTQFCRLVIAGRPCDCDAYWRPIREEVLSEVRKGGALLKDDFIPDEETEVYFKAADVLVLPYKHVYQSGVLFLGYSFGLPVLAADVGSLRDEIVEGQTGFIFKPKHPRDLRRAIEQYFASELYVNLESRRQDIISYSTTRHSWDVVAQRTIKVYAELLGNPPDQAVNRCEPTASLDVKCLREEVGTKSDA